VQIKPIKESQISLEGICLKKDASKIKAPLYLNARWRQMPLPAGEDPVKTLKNDQMNGTACRK
jgi:hypothetical protein